MQYVSCSDSGKLQPYMPNYTCVHEAFRSQKSPLQMNVRHLCLHATAGIPSFHGALYVPVICKRTLMPGRSPHLAFPCCRHVDEQGSIIGQDDVVGADIAMDESQIPQAAECASHLRNVTKTRITHEQGRLLVGFSVWPLRKTRFSVCSCARVFLFLTCSCLFAAL